MIFFLSFFSFLGQNLGYWSFYLLKFIFFKCFVSKSVLEPEPVGAELLYVEPEPKKKNPEPESRKNGSAPQRWLYITNGVGQVYDLAICRHIHLYKY